MDSVLGVHQLKVMCQFWEHEFLEDFYTRIEEGDGSIEIPWWPGLQTFENGTIVVCFHMTGMSADQRNRLYRFVRYCMPRGPRCLM